MICETNWNNGLLYSAEIDPYYWDFGNGYIPFFAVIGAYNQLFFGENGVNDATATVPAAIASFNNLGIVAPIADQVLDFNESITFDVSEMFASPNGDITVTIEGNTNPAIATAEITDDILTVTAQSTLGMTMISIMGDDGVMTATDEFNVVVLDPNPNTETLEFTIEDTPEQQNYPSNPNPYDNTWTDFSWTSITITEDEPIINMHICGDLFSDNYPSEGSLYMTSPNGTTILIADGFSSGTNAVNIEIMDFLAQSCAGEWIIYFEDSYGDGGHALYNGSLVIEVPGEQIVNDPPTNLAVTENGYVTWMPPGGVENFEEGFETWPPADWTFLDEDGDSFMWDDGGALGLDAYEGDGLAYSASYINDVGALYPDNWLITPPVMIAGATDIMYHVCAQDAAWAGEHYGVYISDTGTDPADFDLLFEETMTARSSEKILPKGSRDQGAWYERTVLVEGYSGECYIAFRHFNVSDMFYLDLDEITICPAAPARPLESYNVYLDGGLLDNTADIFYQLTNLIEGEIYEVGVTAVYTEGESEMISTTFTYEPTSSGEELPAATALVGNYPNPFNPECTIEFAIANDNPVVINIYNSRGQHVRTLVDENMQAGNHQVVWNGTDDNGKSLASGVYYYKMDSGKYTSSKKMVLMK